MALPLEDMAAASRGDDACTTSALFPSEAIEAAVSATAAAAGLSAATYSLDDSAFASWRESMTASVQLESAALHDHVIQLQREFDDASHFIRGDFAWRKQVSAFHDRMNDVVVQAMDATAKRLQQSTQSLAASLDDTLATKDSLAKQEMERQASMYEDKLRRTRTSLKKEINRFTHLEKCLRNEETHQAKAMYDRLVDQLAREHAAKEATLHAMLRELKVAYRTIESANDQLLSTVKSRDDEIERIKKLLPKPKDQTTGLGPGGSSRGGTSYSSRPGSAAAAAAAAASAMAAAAASDSQVQSLKQALLSANSTIDTLRKQVEESASDKDSTLKRQRQAESAADKASEELTKVKLLLSESHGALVANRKDMETLLQEKIHWKELYAELHFHSGSHEHALDDARRLTQAAQHEAESLQAQLQLNRRSPTSVTGADDQLAIERESLETQLRYEFERKYGDVLNLRISHERKRALARIEMLWAARQEDDTVASSMTSVSSKRTAKLHASDSRHNVATAKPVKRGASLQQILQLVSEAFQDLGFSDWASTDLDRFQHEITRLQKCLQTQQKAHEQLQQHSDTLAVRVTTLDLHKREQEMLLTELTERYRKIRAQLESDDEIGGGNGNADHILDLSRWENKSDPFTVYGQPQPIEAKQSTRRSSASSLLVRVRPVSASATLMTGNRGCSAKDTMTATTTPARGMLARSSISTSSTSPASRKQHRPAGPNAGPAPLKPFLLHQLPPATGPYVALQQHEDHVRSVLKADLLSLTPQENQLDDGSLVGADGILQIMQRRRHNRKP